MISKMLEKVFSYNNEKPNYDQENFRKKFFFSENFRMSVTIFEKLIIVGPCLFCTQEYRFVEWLYCTKVLTDRPKNNRFVSGSTFCLLSSDVDCRLPGLYFRTP